MLLFAGSARGQGVKASTLFDRGRALFAEGQYAEAAEAFEAANSLAPHAATLHNAALAWDKINELARAADDYELALNAKLSDALAPRARLRLATLKRLLGYVIAEVPVGATLTVAHVRRASIPTRFHLRPGQYQVTVEGMGPSADTQSLTVAAGETRVLALRAASAPIQPAPSPWPSVVGWTGVGVGVAAGATAAALGVTFRNENKKFEASDRTDAMQRDRLIALQRGANISWAIAGTATAAGTALLLYGWLRPKPEMNAASSNVSVVVGPAAVSVVGVF